MHSPLDIPQPRHTILAESAIPHGAGVLGFVFSMKTFASLALAGTIFLGEYQPTHAATLLSDTGGDGAVQFHDTVGFSFTVGAAPLSVTQLGVWDKGGDGLSASNTVALWDESGTMLGVVSMPPGTSAPLIAGFRYGVLLSEVLLSVNTTYVLAAFANGEDRETGVPAPNFSPDGSLVGTRRNDAQFVFGFPSLFHGSIAGQAIVGPNIQYNIVPEPGTALFGLALETVATACRNRRSLC